MKVRHLIFLLFFFTFPVRSEVINIQVSDYGFLDILPPLSDLFDDYLEGEERKLNEDQPIIDPDRIAKGSANSAALSMRGVGTSYTSEMENYMIGFGVGAAADLEKDVAIKDEISGIGANPSFIFGIRGDKLPIAQESTLDLSHVSFFINFGSGDTNTTIPSNDIDIATELEATNFGFHVRYDLIQPERTGSVRWGGIKIQTGYEFTQNTVTLQTEIDELLEFDSGSGFVLNGELKGKPVYEIESNIHTFPLEVTSDVTFFKVLTLFGGLGADLNFGSAEGEGDVNGEVSPLVCTGPFCLSGDPLPQVEITADLNASHKPDTLSLRGFAGIQLNVMRVHVYGLINKPIGNDVLGASAGVRYSF